jgi:DNA repair exonuclease SbcCD ATPase subunit
VAQARADITAGLPEAEQLASLTRTVERSRERERLGRRVLQLSRNLALGKARLAVMQSLPEAAPALENTSSAQNILKRLSDLRHAAHIAQGRMAQVDEGLKSVQVEMARLVEETGGLCPTCGSPVKPENLFDHHAHSSHSATPSERLTA